jgi:uncharacterized membrane protein SpoIIM required for sporulation
MKETTFIEQNKKKWARFEKMSSAKQSDPDELSQLFVEITDDLAYARTYYPKRSVRVYLNGLAQRVFHDLYKRRKEPLSKFVHFWTTGLPLEMYRARYYVLTAFLIFLVGMLIGIVSTVDDEDFLGAVIGYGYVEMAEENIANGRPMNVYGSFSELDGFLMIAVNNLRVAFLTFVLGIFFALGSIVFLFYNAIMVGAFQWFYVVRGLTLASFLTIWIHGAFEIPAIILAAAAGITVGMSFMFPGTLTRGQALVKGAKSGIKMMIGLIPVIILAAFIEGYATRHTVITLQGEPLANEWPDSVKWLFILSCFGLFFWYFIWYPLRVARKIGITDKVEERPQFKAQKQIILYKIKDVGELFTDTFITYRKLFGLFFRLFAITIPLQIGYLFLLMENFPYYYKMNSEGGWTFESIIGGRFIKMFENLEVLFVWNEFFNPLLFALQVVIFTLNGLHILFAFKVIFVKDTAGTFSGYLHFMGIHFIKLLPVYLIFGAIACFAPIGLMFVLSGIAPLLFMFDKPMLFGKGSLLSRLGKGFGMGFKAYGNAMGVFYSILITLVIVYVFVGIPMEIIKDFVIDWVVLPLAKNPKYWLILVDASMYMFLCHLMFPIFHLTYTYLYYSTQEENEGIGMFEKLESFGEANKLYETSTRE